MAESVAAMIPLRDTLPSERTPVVTWTLIAFNVLVFVYQVGLSPEELRTLFYTYGLVPAAYTHSGWAEQAGLQVSLVPLFSNAFLHGGFLHLLGNMWMLWIFGDNVEDRMGRWRFLVFYVACGMAATLLHVLANQDSQIPVLGASGAIAGVLGAYFVFYPGARVLAFLPILFYPLFFRLPAPVFIGLWLLTQVVSGTLEWVGNVASGIAWWAHIGGFLAGVALHRLFMQPQRRYRRVVYPWGPQGPAAVEYRARRDDLTSTW